VGHAAHVPNHEPPAPCRGWPASGPGRLGHDLWFLAEGGAGAPRSRAGPEDAFCEAFEKDLRVLLTVRGHSPTLSGPSQTLNALAAARLPHRTGHSVGSRMRESGSTPAEPLRDDHHGVVSVPLQGLRHRAEDVVVSVLGSPDDDDHGGAGPVAYTLLSEIYLTPGVRAADLCAHFGLDKSTLSRQLEQLISAPESRRAGRPGSSGRTADRLGRRRHRHVRAVGHPVQPEPGVTGRSGRWPVRP
jgi:hypothetical protein